MPVHPCTLYGHVQGPKISCIKIIHLPLMHDDEIDDMDSALQRIAAATCNDQLYCVRPTQVCVIGVSERLAQYSISSKIGTA